MRYEMCMDIWLVCVPTTYVLGLLQSDDHLTGTSASDSLLGSATNYDAGHPGHPRGSGRMLGWLGMSLQAWLAWG